MARLIGYIFFNVSQHLQVDIRFCGSVDRYLKVSIVSICSLLSVLLI